MIKNGSVALVIKELRKKEKYQVYQKKVQEVFKDTKKGEAKLVNQYRPEYHKQLTTAIDLLIEYMCEQQGTSSSDSPKESQ